MDWALFSTCEVTMGKYNKHQSDRQRFGKCEICLEYIAIEYYFNKGDQITCYECGTEYLLVSKNPVKLTIQDHNGYDHDFDVSDHG